MKIIAYYHILLINNWEEIVKSQVELINESGLIDEIEEIKIGCLGSDENMELLKTILPDKYVIHYHSANIHEYEFATLRLIEQDAKTEKPYYGLYFHTKGVSFPGNSGGKYWRDYMNYYNICLWKECQKKLRKGYDTCGVKLLTESDYPAYKLHYSGNFFWFKSSYIKKCKKIEQLNLKDRFQAEFWIGTGSPTASTLCQKFVDYNTIGTFYVKKTSNNYVHTLAYNFPSEVEKTTELLYKQNDNFKHYIVDLGFPLVDDNYPEDLNKSRQHNTKRLKEICRKYGSTYIQMPNIGVSQNWTQIYKHIKPGANDIIIGADPDERTLDSGWVDAMGEVLRSGKVSLVSLMMTDHISMMETTPKTESTINGIKTIFPHINFNWALIGLSGKFLDKIGGVPIPAYATRYGYLEHEILRFMSSSGDKWCMLPEYRVRHTDYSLGDSGSKILRDWKNYIIFSRKGKKQISLDEYLKLKMSII